MVFVSFQRTLLCVLCVSVCVCGIVLVCVYVQACMLECAHSARALFFCYSISCMRSACVSHYIVYRISPFWWLFGWLVSFYYRTYLSHTHTHSLSLSLSPTLFHFYVERNRFQILHPDHIQFYFSLHLMSHIRMHLCVCKCASAHVCVLASFKQIRFVHICLTVMDSVLVVLFFPHIFSILSANASVFFVYHLNSGWCLKFK